MKRKLMIRFVVVTIVATLLGGCGIVGETKIEYERPVKALDEGDMATVMSAGEDGEHSKTVYQTTEGIYNTKEKILYGDTTQEIVTDIEKEENLISRENYKDEHIYDANIMYTDGKVTSANPNVDVSYIKMIIDSLQGIAELEPTNDTKGGSEPNTVGYTLTEAQFQEIVNAKLKIEYDEFKHATITLDFDSAKDSSTSPMELVKFGIMVSFNKKNEEGQSLYHQYQTYYSFNSKKDNEEAESKEDYKDNKEEYLNR
ncbi:DUF3952 domain-containing protein [Bacillus manliponensis]|uniref:DUF3952 domain-containing protein n=1 Tax=Bacillus manliponensis TaxID=574376 RepID=UPI0035110EE3